MGVPLAVFAQIQEAKQIRIKKMIYYLADLTPDIVLLNMPARYCANFIKLFWEL